MGVECALNRRFTGELGKANGEYMESIILVVALASLVVSVAAVVMIARIRQADSGVQSEQWRRQLEQVLGEQVRAQEQLRLQQAALQTEVSTLRGMTEAQGKANSNSVLQLQQAVTTRMDEVSQQFVKLTQANADSQVGIQKSLAEELERIRNENRQSMATVREETAKSLDKIRATVDEKLQTTLEKRIGESFQLVSQRLEQVQKGLGEMQTLANDVGGLKRVLTNVKQRGIFGEVQLSRQLGDMLTPEQYVENASIVPGSRERVEFAVRLPGKEDDEPVLLPIDSKFPQESYERLLTAQEGTDKEAIDAARKELEAALTNQAKEITKYIQPPHSTDFAIMYLPTEGLFAEALRLPGLVSKLQSQYRVIVTGPTTLAALLNSLQIGFKTLAIEKRSTEVWHLLSALKQEFGKYIELWEKLSKQLNTAQKTVESIGRKGRTVERKLSSVEILETAESVNLLPSLETDDEAGDSETD